MNRVAGRRRRTTGEWTDRTTSGLPFGRHRSCGFSLVELIVVMSVTVVLTGLLLPALAHLKENAHRVICSSNLRQIGLATVMYADGHSGALPRSYYAQSGNFKGEMMAAHRGKFLGSWEGLGWLFAEMYTRTPEVFYCPSHHGQHPYIRYEDVWLGPAQARIYTNYQYAGDFDWEKNRLRRLSEDGLVIASDGLRSVSDFNHRTGTNLLYGDCSVAWRDDIRQILGELPVVSDEEEDPDEKEGSDEDLYTKIWHILNTR